jgi:cyclopropane fatty-acyl-phospholipid synthase-like methyltransferase
MKNNYLDIVRHYEKCFELYGDTSQGVDWPNQEDAKTRYRVMIEALHFAPSETLLDFGCGLAHFHDFLEGYDALDVKYAGLELSEKMLGVIKKKKPAIDFYSNDVISDGWQMPQFDFTVMNGVFTEKLHLKTDQMFDYMTKLIKIVFDNSKVGLAFNVMSTQVDWERDDLFHLSLDKLAWFIKEDLSRKYIIRNDYGLYEYTVYIFK